MGLDIVSNIMAQDASNSLSVNETNMQDSLDKLSSGYQINKAADDASGLVISQHLQSQIGGFQQAQANTQSAINVVQTADGALNEVGTILQRINTLAVEAANTTATDTHRLDRGAGRSQPVADVDRRHRLHHRLRRPAAAGFDGGQRRRRGLHLPGRRRLLSRQPGGLHLRRSFGERPRPRRASPSAAASHFHRHHRHPHRSALRGTLGAYQNELQHISDNEGVMVQNLQASNAQIQDTNMASQMSTSPRTRSSCKQVSPCWPRPTRSPSTSSSSSVSVLRAGAAERRCTFAQPVRGIASR